MTTLEPFGPKTGWLAVPDCSPADLAAALGVGGGEPVDCLEAVEAAEDEENLAILPPLPGTSSSPGVGGLWTLAVGLGLAMTSAAAVARWSGSLARPVQRFGTYRVTESHCWTLADRGQVLRHVAVEGERGELVGWTGRPTPVELGLGLPDRPGIDVAEEAMRVVRAINETTVLAIAQGWSLNPDTLTGPAPGPVTLYEDVTLG